MTVLFYHSFIPNILGGSCAKMIAAKTSAQPQNSRMVSTWFRSSQPLSMAKTLSKLMSIEAMTELTCFCPTICKV